MENKDNHFVSVIIPTYKRATMLDRAIASVLGQTYPNVEAVIVDDNDPASEWRKKTESMMSKYSNNDRVQYIKHEKNMNGSVARNTGIYHAMGDIVCFLDDDDEFCIDKIEKQVAYLDSHRQFRAVYCGWDRGQGVVLPSAEGDLSFELLSGVHLIYTNTIMMFKEDAIRCGGWDESFKRHQEAAFMLRYFRMGGKIGVVSENLVKFDVSDRGNQEKNSAIYEDYMRHYLEVFTNEIDNCEEQAKGAKNFIYANRLRGVMFMHIKDKNFMSALKIYYEMMKICPITFNKNILKYIYRKVRGGVRNE